MWKNLLTKGVPGGNIFFAPAKCQNKKTFIKKWKKVVDNFKSVYYNIKASYEKSTSKHLDK